MELYIFALLGIITHFLMLLKQATKKNNFVFYYFLNMNAVQFALSCIISFVLVYQYYSAPEQATEALNKLFGSWSWLIQLGAFGIGLMSGDILYRIEKTFGDVIENIASKIKSIFKRK